MAEPSTTPDSTRSISHAWLTMVPCLLGAAMVSFTFTRLALLTFHLHEIRTGPGEILAAMAVGAAYDLLVSLWLVLPVAIYLALLPPHWWHRPTQRRFFGAFLFLGVYGLLFVVLAEWLFFAELGGRFNFVAVDYLIYPHEVVTNIWQSYPTGWILVTLAAVALAVAVGAARLADGEQLERRSRRVGAALALTAMAGVLTSFSSPSWSLVSRDRVLNEIAGNGLYTFFAALRGSHASFDGLYAALPAPEVFARLGRLLEEPAMASPPLHQDSVVRQIENHGPATRRNVVVVLEESLGSEHVGVLRRGLEQSLTPRLDALAAEGTLLTRVYATGNRTIRAIEATTAGLPPLPGVSLVRRPQSRDLFTLPAVLREQGYQTLFVYGGRALFDGMGSYLEHNGVERVIEQRHYPKGTFRTAWGVADEAIFERALAELDTLAAAGTPFYSLILSVSNHRPFLFPEDRIQGRPELSGRENTVRYADFALGSFMEQAKARGWYDNTVFVLMGDHGARVYGSTEIPLRSYEVPILLIGPGIEPGARVDTISSSLDIPPMVLAQLGLDYESRFFGRNVLSLPADQGRALMTHNSSIALLEGDRLVVLGLRGSSRVYECDLDVASCDEVGERTQRDQELVADTIAYYRGANVVYSSGAHVLAPSLLGAQITGRPASGSPEG